MMNTQDVMVLSCLSAKQQSTKMKRRTNTLSMVWPPPQTPIERRIRAFDEIISSYSKGRISAEKWNEMVSSTSDKKETDSLNTRSEHTKSNYVVGVSKKLFERRGSMNSSFADPSSFRSPSRNLLKLWPPLGREKTEEHLSKPTSSGGIPKVSLLLTTASCNTTFEKKQNENEACLGTDHDDYEIPLATCNAKPKLEDCSHYKNSLLPIDYQPELVPVLNVHRKEAAAAAEEEEFPTLPGLIETNSLVLLRNKLNPKPIWPPPASNHEEYENRSKTRASIELAQARSLISPKTMHPSLEQESSIVASTSGSAKTRHHSQERGEIKSSYNDFRKQKGRDTLSGAVPTPICSDDRRTKNMANSEQQKTPSLQGSVPVWSFSGAAEAHDEEASWEYHPNFIEDNHGGNCPEEQQEILDTESTGNPRTVTVWGFSVAKEYEDEEAIWGYSSQGKEPPLSITVPVAEYSPDAPQGKGGPQANPFGSKEDDISIPSLGFSTLQPKRNEEECPWIFPAAKQFICKAVNTSVHGHGIQDETDRHSNNPVASTLQHHSCPYWWNTKQEIHHEEDSMGAAEKRPNMIFHKRSSHDKTITTCKSATLEKSLQPREVRPWEKRASSRLNTKPKEEQTKMWWQERTG